ncbi:MAG: hypothetical protein VX278_05145 [Myxococcota bacterium]|nr:hypothetical protein [Myxococcota bacterium]
MSKRQRILLHGKNIIQGMQSVVFGTIDTNTQRESLLIETQRGVFRELHKRFLERAHRGEKGLASALDALDSMWSSIRTLSPGAPFLVETLGKASQKDHLRLQLQDFYLESTRLLEDGIRAVFSDQLHQLSIPPERMAKLIRILLEGLLIELAHAQNEHDLAQVDQAYADMRQLFAQFVLKNEEDPVLESAENLVLPW